MYRKFLRPGWVVGHLLVVVAVLVCLRLGWWQWDRTHEKNGTIQNLGYAILWPVFAAAFVYMWFRFLQLEVVKDAEDDAELTALASGDAGSTRPAGGPVAAPDAAEGRPSGPTASGPTASGLTDRADLTSSDLGSLPVAPVLGGSRPVEQADTAGAAQEPVDGAVPAASRRTPSRGFTVAVSTVGDENEDDEPELAAYNRALADLAEKDHRRAR